MDINFKEVELYNKNRQEEASSYNLFDKTVNEYVNINANIDKSIFKDYFSNDFLDSLERMDKEDLEKHYIILLLGSYIRLRENIDEHCRLLDETTKDYSRSYKEKNSEIEKLREEVKRKQRVTNSVYSKIKDNSLNFLLNSNISKEDKELFKETFSDFL